jgi:uncharacterized protein with GYD domain
MATFITLVNFTEQGIKSVKESPKRAEAFKAMAAKAGASVKSMYWTLGHYDLVATIEAPDTATATRSPGGRFNKHPYQTLTAFGRTSRQDPGEMPA